MVRVGLIGTGKWGNNHLRVYSQLQKLGLCEFIGIADVDPSKKTLADEYGVAFATDFKELLPNVDCVSVVVPTNFHYPIVKACLEAGKHVLVEKPITLKSEEAEELVALAQQNNLVLSVGYLFRFNPSVRKLKEMIASGELGAIQYMQARYIHSSKPPRADSGVIFNLGIHLVDILNFVLQKHPTSLYSKQSVVIDGKNEDSATSLLNYDNFYVELEMSCCHPLKKRDMWIIAEKKKVYVDFLDQSFTIYPISIENGDVVRGAEYRVSIEKNEPLKEELLFFVEAVKKTLTGQQVENIGSENPMTTKITELLCKSAVDCKELSLE